MSKTSGELLLPLTEHSPLIKCLFAYKGNSPIKDGFIVPLCFDCNTNDGRREGVKHNSVSQKFEKVSTKFIFHVGSSDLFSMVD